MSRVVAALFGVLVAATFAAFFVAQRMKNAPSVIQQLNISPFFSPNRDGRFDRARVTLKLKEADDVTIAITDADGDPVRTLLDDERLEAYTPLKPSVPWDGRDDEGQMVPDGRYKVRITLRGQGRSVLATRSIRKDTTPPAPVVDSIGPEKAYGPELLPNPAGAPATARFRPAPRYSPRVRLFKTAPGAPREVAVHALGAGERSWSWDGRIAGRRASPGTYLVVLEWRDQAGNVGTSVPLDRRGLPVLDRGRLPGRGGITVRYLAASAPVEPVKAREPLPFAVDARQEPFSWTIRRVGESQPRKRGGPKQDPRVVTTAPGGASGVYLIEARAGGRTTRVPVAVQARRPRAGTAESPRGVLVVLPAMTWQGRNALDDDGDGAPNTLDLGGPARLNRPMTGDGLPAGFAEREAPLLMWLDREGRRYDLTTDAALHARRGPRMTGHRGVLIAGDARWLSARVRQDLRTFARRGGVVASLGIDSLRRSVTVDARGRLAHPSRPRPTDLFGARLRPLVHRTTDLEIFQDGDVQLFSGTGGLVKAVPSYEETAGTGQEADAVSSAVTVDPPGRTVVVAARFGKGLVIRPGFPAFTQRLSTDPAVSALMARMWTLLSR